MKITVRQEKAIDFEDITLLNDIAFGQEHEGLLVERLRKKTPFVKALSRVAVFENSIVGHILFYPVKIVNELTEYESLALAPMSVIPELQNMEIGSQLVKDGLETAKNLGFKSVIVLGHKDFYPRFGFSPAVNWKIKAPFEVPDEVFMAIELLPGGLKAVSGTVLYPIEFNM